MIQGLAGRKPAVNQAPAYTLLTFAAVFDVKDEYRKQVGQGVDGEICNIRLVIKL